ncbi:hypothetical protein [Spirochaeta africana]|uniref:Uncharacterized protein n=1 Tax=Spirochaeta africana (strain ATCC 700263 / DSM 8902 / Z-7692) TaxID=889378 RepID=H9UKG6_SPIAZ|nr:hypothetical protein [Spirochaeta africana]AFG38009.1 hypothetical protein Spiaf_1958 [Spirochaeta africana DSM 8902]
MKSTCISGLWVLLSVALLLAVPASVYAQRSSDAAEHYIRSFDPADYPSDRWTHHDRNGNGTADYVVLHNRQGLRIQEVYDYSGDGQLDDFYFYNDGELVMRELDTVGDGQIDVWVQLVNGHLVSEIRRDTTGDGQPDYVRSYD